LNEPDGTEEADLHLSRRHFLGVLSAVPTSVAFAADDPDKTNVHAYGYKYRIATAESVKGQSGSKFLSNLNGQIGLVYDAKNGEAGSREGVSGRVWRGRPVMVGDPFAIWLEEEGGGAAYKGLKIAYVSSGRDRSVNLHDQTHGETLWRQVRPKKEWFQKHIVNLSIPFHLQAAAGEFKDYYFDFAEPELVKLPDDGELKDRSYMRRQAILVKEPSELSVLVKRELRSR
jgi:hypothetical protein